MIIMTNYQAPTKTCEDCGGSGVCSKCNGEGFVLRRLSDEGAEKARLMAKNMATRYTAGLPKKWSYCTKCSSARSCVTCGGSGKLSYMNQPAHPPACSSPIWRTKCPRLGPNSRPALSSSGRLREHQSCPARSRRARPGPTCSRRSESGPT
ncbi:Unknown protein, partial [Striga hermonthica]